MIPIDSFSRTYRLKAYCVFGAALLILLLRFIGHGAFHSLHGTSPLLKESELFYRLFVASKVPLLLAEDSPIAWAFDIALLALPVLFILTLNRWLAVAFTFSLLLYFFTFNVVTGHHYHGLIGALIISTPFWIKDETRFNLLWRGVRYYLLYIFVSAALWKIFRGSVFYTEQMSNILKAQQLSLLLQSPDCWRAHFIQYLIANPPVAHWVLIVNVLVQLSFAIAFFTKRFDWLLLALMLVFCVGNYFVMSIVSGELLILGLALVSWDRFAGNK
jgi:hypothetical protein